MSEAERVIPLFKRKPRTVPSSINEVAAMTISPYLNRVVCKKQPMRGVSTLYYSNYLILVAVSICLIVFGT
ncbi:MAG: hypothetical protein QN819_10655, partial [Nitrososphaeraceae archaeon]|nr:hypothetical protein [Nitrososphaeraceae archaeon]